MPTFSRQLILKSVTAAGVSAALLAGCASVPGSVRGGAALVSDRSHYKDLSVYQGSQDRGNIGWKLFGQFDPGKEDHVFFEAAYQQMGDTKFDGLYEDVPDQGTIETTTIEASVAYRYPLTQTFSAGGRLGAAYVDVEEREIFGGAPYSSSASETVPFAGVMFRVGIGDNWGVSAHWDRYLDVGKAGQTGEGDIDAYGISADFRFGGSNSQR